MNNNMPVTYTPKGLSIEGHRGPFVTTRLMWRELVTARELIWRLFIRDFKAKYRQTVLGVVWAVLMPLITVGIFVVMSRSGLLAVEDVGMPYFLYALIGLTVWSLFTVGMTACTNALVNAGSMIIKINFPKVALIIAASGQGVVEFLIRLAVIAAFFLYYEVAPSWHGMFLALVSLIPLYLVTLGLGFILSLVAGIVRDMINVLNIVLIGMLLLTPVLYPITGDSLLARANIYNPFNYLVNVPRDFIVQGRTELLAGFMWIAIFSCILFYLSWKLFYLAQTKIAERI